MNELNDLVKFLCQFFFQDIGHFVGGLVYIWSTVMAFGISLGLVTEAVKK